MNEIQDSRWFVGISRKAITPPLHCVELAGLGYFLNRTGERIRDDLNATALVIENKQSQCIAIVAMDIMYGGEDFTRSIREQASAQTGIPIHAICINCSHSHNAPMIAARINQGLGAFNSEYAQFAANQAVEAIKEAWRQRTNATLSVGWGEVKHIAFNRTRENGPLDSRVSVLRADGMDGKPLAVVLNHHVHLNARLDANLRVISRDLSGDALNEIEAALPGTTAMYLQGTCGDVMVRKELSSTDRSDEPGRAIAEVALQVLKGCRKVNGDNIAFCSHQIKLPTRRWKPEEIMRDRNEALYRLETGDTKNWLDGFAKVIVTYPDRLPLRYGGSVEKAVKAASRFVIEWTDAILSDLDTRPEYIETEVQAIRVGDVWFAAHSAELFTSLGLEVRRRWEHQDLFLLGYSNGAIGYLPDAHDVERKSYAAYQSPKFTGQFPFTSASGTAMVEGLLSVLNQTAP